MYVHKRIFDTTAPEALASALAPYAGCVVRKSRQNEAGQAGRQNEYVVEGPLALATAIDKAVQLFSDD